MMPGDKGRSPGTATAHVSVTAQATSAPVSGPATPLDLNALDSLRVAACAAVMAFHALLYWGTLLPLQKGEKLLETVLPLRLAHFGNAGVDIFLVLTGLLATWQLVPALETAAAGAAPAATAAQKQHPSGGLYILRESVWPQIKQYYRKRVLRVLPAYATALAAVALAINHAPDAHPSLKRAHDVVFAYCPASLPLNFMLLNNFIGFGGCGVHFWSLAVQLHFWLAFPLLLRACVPGAPGFRRRVAMGTSVTLATTIALRWVAAHATGVSLPVIAFAHSEMTDEAANGAMVYYHTLYFPTPARLGNLAVGVLLGLAALAPGAAKAAKTTKVKAIVAAVGALPILGVAAVAMTVKTWGPVAEAVDWKYPRAFAAFLYHGSPLYCAAAAAAVAAAALGAGPLGALCQAASRTRVVKHLSKVSYDVYLLHMVALYWFEAATVAVTGRAALAAVVEAHPVLGYAAVLAVTYGSGYLAGVAHQALHAAAGRVISAARARLPARKKQV